MGLDPPETPIDEKNGGGDLKSVCRFHGHYVGYSNHWDLFEYLLGLRKCECGGFVFLLHITIPIMALHILFTWLAVSLPLLIFLLSVKNFNNKKKNLPPGPPPLPIIGNLHQLGHLPHQSLWKLSRRYGPVMFIRLGGVPTIVTSSPEAAREVLKTHDLDCCSRPRLVGTGRLTYDSLDMAFVEYGDYWREVRKLCVLELFSAKRVHSFRYIREEEVGSMIESIAKSAESGTPINMSEKFMALTANFTCR